MRSEPDWENAPSHQVRSMAQTRACGKTQRNKFAYIMVMAGLQGTPAEELTGTAPSEPAHRKGETECAQCSNRVSTKRATKTKNQYGRVLCITCEKAAYLEQERTQEAKPEPMPCGPDCTNPEHAWHEPKPSHDPQKVLNFDQIKPGPQPVVKVLDRGKETPYAI